MTEQVEPTTIDVSPKAASAIRARGGNLYVWRDKAGMIRARTKPPSETLAYDTFSGDGWVVHVARGIFLLHDGEADRDVRWLISWGWLPWPHLRALWESPPDPFDTSSLVEEVLSGVFKPWTG